MNRLFVILPLLSAGCVSIEKIAPPVAGPLLETAAGHGIAAHTLERGRMIYLNQCAACHTAEPVDRYTLPHWERILPEMNEEAKLNATQAADVAAYIRIAHATMTSVKPNPDPKP